MDKPEFAELYAGKNWDWELLFQRMSVAIAKLESMYDAMIPILAQAQNISADEAEAKMNKRMAEYFSDQFTAADASNLKADRE